MQFTSLPPQDTKGMHSMFNLLPLRQLALYVNQLFLLNIWKRHANTCKMCDFLQNIPVYVKWVKRKEEKKTLTRNWRRIFLRIET